MRERNQSVVVAAAVVCGLLMLPVPCDAKASAGNPKKASVERVVPGIAHARDYGIDHYMVQSQSHQTTITPMGPRGKRLGRIVVTDRPGEFGLRVEDESRAVRDWTFRQLSADRFLVRLQSRSAAGKVESSVFHYDTASAEMLAVDPEGRITTVPQPLDCDATPDGTAGAGQELPPVGAALLDPNLRGYLPAELIGFSAGLGGEVFLASSCATCVTSCGVCLACAAAGCGGAVACAGCAAACVMCFNSCSGCMREYQDQH